MNISYSTNKLEKKLSTASEIKKGYGVLAKRLIQRLDEIRAAPNLAVLMKLPTADCHPLKGNRQGQWSVHISGNYCIVFTLNHDPVPKTELGEINTIEITEVEIIEITDYH